MLAHDIFHYLINQQIKLLEIMENFKSPFEQQLDSRDMGSIAGIIFLYDKKAAFNQHIFPSLVHSTTGCINRPSTINQGYSNYATLVKNGYADNNCIKTTTLLKTPYPKYKLEEAFTKKDSFIISRSRLINRCTFLCLYSIKKI